jgi:hypothetical protein
MLTLFTLTLFVSSALLFVVEPMVARMVLPVLGGTPAVWNTCMVFFQAALLAGYLYAHAGPRLLGLRRHAILHLALLSLALATLPTALRDAGTPPVDGTPVFWLLRVLTATVGLPFFLVGATSPMLQRWLANTDHTDAADPYFLYAAGNAGSFLALLGYPVIIERTLRLGDQSRYWAVGYAVLTGLTLLCFVWTARRSAGAAEPLPARAVGADAARITLRQRAWWVALAFIPSSLVLGVTTFLTTDIAPAPLLWVMPLAVYLLTFVLVFATRPPIPHAVVVRFFPLIVLPLVVLMVFDSVLPVAALVTVHLAAFFMAAMVCHGELSRSRPPSDHITEFYVWLSVGGVLGGLFNALVAPVIFKTVVEYPLAVVLACLARRPPDPRPSPANASTWDIALPIALGAGSLGIMLAIGGAVGATGRFLVFAVPMVICYGFRHRPVRFALGVAALVVAGTTFMRAQEDVALRSRSFFGVRRVTLDPTGRWRGFMHGRILHGAQSVDPARRREPTLYFHRSGPIGQVFAAMNGTGATRRVAVVGLGIGTLAAYSAPGEDWTFYEIDPAVERIARDTRYFTYLADSPASVRVVIGDARLKLASAPDGAYTMMILDAFASDAIPVHLVTREALRVYSSKVDSHAVIAFHVSNRFVDLEPVLGALAHDAGLVAIATLDTDVMPGLPTERKAASNWVVIARSAADLRGLAADSRWHAIAPGGVPVWTDDFSNMLSIVRWTH